ncbi:MAG: HD domain-containing protein [Bacteroidales bacterium]|nr:HD domain-containing protein [Bacteroidales bacterium]
MKNDLKRTEFINLLKSTNRDGIDEVIEELDTLGFFEAPASSRHHLNDDQGLLEHSLNVYYCSLKVRDMMAEFRPELKEECPDDSIIIAALLHDVCKSDIYKKTTRRRKDKNGGWEYYAGYNLDYSNFPLGHGEKSVIMLLRCGLAMSDNEIMAIRWHMTAWDLPFQSLELKKCLNTARELSPLCTIIQAGDTLAAGIIEQKVEEEEDEYYD